jgi:hypothetical protein
MKQRYLLLWNENLLAVAGSLISFCVYVTTMCRTVSFIDSGELATVTTVLGIAHPTGYPLFTLIGRCAVMLPLGLEEILKLNLFSAFVTAAAMGVFFKMSLALWDLFQDRRGVGRAPQPGAEDKRIRTAAFIVSLAFAFSATVWEQSTAIEVYGLHLFLLCLVILTCARGLKEQIEDGEQTSRQLILFSFVLGLSFSNHMTTILIIPGLVYLFVRFLGMGRAAVVRLVKLIPFFILGASTYLYLPIRSSAHLPLDWGHPTTLERFLWHISGKQYRSWIFSGFESAEKQLTYFVNHFPSEFSWIIIALFLFGVWKTFRRNQTLFWFLAIGFVSCVFYSINYDIHDIDSYFLLAYAVVALFAVFGLGTLNRMVEKKFGSKAFAGFAVALLLLPAVQVWGNAKTVSESDNYLVEDYTQNILSSIEPNAFVLTYQWDYFVAPSLYYQVVRGNRTDVVIVDKELLRRSWYYIQLERRYPWLIQRSKEKVDAFLRELWKFEHDVPYDPRVIEFRYVDMINDFISKSLERGPVYVGPEIEAEFGTAYSRIPSGLLFRLARDPGNLPLPSSRIHFRPSSLDDRLTRGLQTLAAQALTMTANYLEAREDPSKALSYIQSALEIQPAFVPALRLREEILNSAKGAENRKAPN